MGCGSVMCGENGERGGCQNRDAPEPLGPLGGVLRGGGGKGKGCHVGASAGGTWGVWRVEGCGNGGDVCGGRENSAWGGSAATCGAAEWVDDDDDDDAEADGGWELLPGMMRSRSLLLPLWLEAGECPLWGRVSSRAQGEYADGGEWDEGAGRESWAPRTVRMGGSWTEVRVREGWAGLGGSRAEGSASCSGVAECIRRE